MARAKQVAWFALQVAIVGGIVWIETQMAAEEHRQPEVGHALTMGFFLAFVVTLASVTLLNGASFLFGRACAAIAGARRPAALAPHIAQTNGEDGQLRLRGSRHSLQKAS
jgi:hypothetical protein